MRKRLLSEVSLMSVDKKVCISHGGPTDLPTALWSVVFGMAFDRVEFFAIVPRLSSSFMHFAKKPMNWPNCVKAVSGARVSSTVVDKWLVERSLIDTLSIIISTGDRISQVMLSPRRLEVLGAVGDRHIVAISFLDCFAPGRLQHLRVDRMSNRAASRQDLNDLGLRYITSVDGDPVCTTPYGQWVIGPFAHGESGETYPSFLWGNNRVLFATPMHPAPESSRSQPVHHDRG